MNAPFVLMYHSVSSRHPDPHGLCVPPATLARQLDALRGRGLRGVGVGELMAAHRAGDSRGLVGLTFDDGYADFVEAADVLAERGFGATVYVVAGRFGGVNDWDGQRWPLLSAAGVREVDSRGFEIGSHTLTHPHLPQCDPVTLRAEVHDSRKILEDLLGHEVHGFAHPFGDEDPAVVRAVAEAGYREAVRADTAPASTAEHPELTLPRSYAGPGDGPVRLAAKRLRHRIAGRGRA
ncbi:polysaccharide deacetylase family protein [Kineococcus sp. SYSU DK001]|uniref:polysaccharide deacetylase family protein n=1 Tax=Kineococcus sp. SYSU DK001 TaxID=3383122 RepID=UPI003D7DA906